MVTVSATDLITRALRLLQVLGATDTPSPEDLQVGKEVLDDFVDGLGTQRAALAEVVRSVYPLSAGVRDYTIGPGGVFNQPQPVWIEGWSIIPDNGAAVPQEIPMGSPLTVQDFQRVAFKDETSTLPIRLYYDYSNSAGLGVISMLPMPTSSSVSVVLYCPRPAAAFADLTTKYVLRTGWGRMYRHNLAVELAPEFGVPAPPNVRAIAVESLAAIKRANWRPTQLSLDPVTPGVGCGGRFDIFAGE